ncbi:diguanylate cyclase [Indiicoccus explosivorum]|uniref:diguanylate cyclase n=1 Tax=Indiicoccus explosivorum TaxID=1917864 RepID=UPI000B451305|nr:diguanylate cyclase [Indiicoccus explosivorum]
MEKGKGRRFGQRLIRRSLIASGIYFAVLIASLGYLYITVSHNYSHVKQTAELLIGLEALERALINQETGIRGFSLTGNPEFLEPFNEGSADYRLAAASIEERAADFTGHTASLEKLISTGAAWHEEFAVPQVKAALRGEETSEARLQAAKVQFDRFRTEQDEAAAAISALRTWYREKMLQDLRWTIGFIGILFILVKLAEFFYFRRSTNELLKPFGQLSEAVASYARGDFSASVPVGAEDDETADLIRGIGVMREELEKDRDFLGQIFMLISSIQEGKTSGEVFRSTIGGMARMVEAPFSSLYTKSADGTYRLQIRYAEGDYQEGTDDTLTEENGIQALIQRRGSAVFEDWETERPPGRLPDALFHRGIRSSAHLLIQNGSEVTGILNLTSRTEGHFSETALDRLKVVSPIIALAIRNAAQNDQLQLIAMQDKLTGLWNRRYFDERLAEMAGQAGAASRPFLFSAILLDVDHFKRFNDTWGHAEGDRVLRHVADLMNRYSRPGDIAARYGGEEFAVLLPDTRADEALEAAERLRQLIAADSCSDRYGITASFGVAEFGAEHSPESLMEQADKALYAAKEMGRNRAVLSRGHSQDSCAGIQRNG